MNALTCPFSSADIAIITEHLVNNIATTTLLAVKEHWITTEDGSPLHMSEQIDSAWGQPAIFLEEIPWKAGQ